MDLRQLTTLVTVAEVGSVTKAARLLHVVQPAISRQIRLLETEVGVPLFERTRHGMVLTEAGQLFVERARRALTELERARSEVRPAIDEVVGIATVGILESVVDLVVEPLVEAVAQRYPGVELRILAGLSGNLQRWLDDGDVDLSLLYNQTDSAAVTVVPMVSERLWAVAPPCAGLATAKPIHWAQVFEHPLVLPVPGHGLRILIDQVLSELHAAPQITMESNSMHVQKNLVLAGCGWTVLPAVGIAKEVAAGAFSGAPLIGPEVIRKVVLGVRRTPRPSRAIRAVAGELTRLVQDQVKSSVWPATLIRVAEQDQP
ncbi:LysR family transcriptional regulator [Mycobacterium sp. NAZ190054]|uniref:LysR family transcriptional regulator n=1 Tax=Mycobacterium sp. NAZ190054 TaxID=1747766 RepID=UPI0007968D2B|nr:LysR family transcriptional regulator [Mycobacterium sp. NAZ190054]KWX67786.1 LysR family transcriptional regulator [Mycobacterium sp. NAZ190054]